MLNSPSLCFSRQQAASALADENLNCSFAERFIFLLRAGCLSQAEAYLFASENHPLFGSELLLLRIYQRHRSGLESLLENISPCSEDRGVYWFAQQTLLLWKGDYQGVLDLGLSQGDEPTCSSWHRLLFAQALLWVGRTLDAKLQQDLLGNDFAPPERVEFLARLAIQNGQHTAALETLAPLLDSGDASPLGWEMAFHALGESVQ